MDVAVSASDFFPSTCSSWKWPVVGLFRPKNGPARPPARQEVARAAPQKPHGLSKSAGERPGRSRGDMDGAGLRDRAQGARSATPPLAVLQVDRDQVSEWVWIRASNIVMNSVRLWVGEDREDLGAYSGDPLVKAPFLGLSNQHFQLMMKRRFEDGALGLFVTDHHSTNGVFIQRNGEGTSDQLTKGKSFAFFIYEYIFSHSTRGTTRIL